MNSNEKAPHIKKNNLDEDFNFQDKIKNFLPGGSSSGGKQAILVLIILGFVWGVFASTCNTNSVGSGNCSSWKHAPGEDRADPRTPGFKSRTIFSLGGLF